MRRLFWVKGIIGLVVLAFFFILIVPLAQAQAKKEPATKAASAQKGPIRIGVIDSYSGMAAVYADDKIKACRMYVDRAKAKGAFWGKIEPIVSDYGL